MTPKKRSGASQTYISSMRLFCALAEKNISKNNNNNNVTVEKDRNIMKKLRFKHLSSRLDFHSVRLPHASGTEAAALVLLPQKPPGATLLPLHDGLRGRG